MVQCIFCHADHQDEEAAPPHTFNRQGMDKLKREGRAECKANRSNFYPGESMAPLEPWVAGKTAIGYKAAAHHCLALSTVSEHRISGELHAAGYDPNRGTNCIWLPYSATQFSKARAYDKPLQKHRGRHTSSYFNAVKKHIDHVADRVGVIFCTRKMKIPKERLLRYMLHQEHVVWHKIASAKDTDYHLYATSFQDPHAPWGTYEKESVSKNEKESVSKKKFRQKNLTAAEIAEDEKIGSESENDPEVEKK